MSIQLNFKNHDFRISVLYNDDSTEFLFDVQKRIELTEVIVERRKIKSYLRNLHRTKNLVKKVTQVERLELFTPRSSRDDKFINEEKVEVKVITQPQTEKPLKITGSQGIELSSINVKLAQVRKSIEKQIITYQKKGRELEEAAEKKKIAKKEKELRRIERNIIKENKKTVFLDAIEVALKEVMGEYITFQSRTLNINQVEKSIRTNIVSFIDPTRCEDAGYNLIVFK